ncbi:Fc receptor-like protein 5 [Saguinus oedipus]|uniref:Fc receptor-like protein 5 n=1 Tax=Saguinus oedipus TaxID=9490 RepID=A0ABQ9TIC4_SAGOE|nr:Fc receptor-like protein 5 [Saguinus oedipus]
MSHPVLTLSPKEALNFEGTKVTLHCKTQGYSRGTSYKFYHEHVLLKHKSARFEKGASISFLLTEEHSGNYYCTADNGRGPERSKAVRLSVTVPVSRPVLTFGSLEDLNFEGATATLHCEAQRGSLPILYQFYHEDVILGRRSAHYTGGVAITFSLTAEHSGNYYCTADNGRGPQRSEAMKLFITGQSFKETVSFGPMLVTECPVLAGQRSSLSFLSDKTIIPGWKTNKNPVASPYAPNMDV